MKIYSFRKSSEEGCFVASEVPPGMENDFVLLEDVEEIKEKLHKIRQWCDAYPLDVFPEPDLKKAADVLKANGITIDTISASNMRHVLNGVKKILDT